MTDQPAVRRPPITGDVLACMAAVGALWLLRQIEPGTASGRLHDAMLSLHLLLELIAVIVASLVAVLSWHTFDDDRERPSTVLLAGFSVVAVCDLMHALAYQGMPRLLRDSDPQVSIFFWLGGRSSEAVTLLILALGLAPRVRRSTALAGALLVSTVLIVIGNFYIDALPRTFVAGAGVTRLKAGCEYLLCAVYLTIALLFVRRARAAGRSHGRLWALSCFIMAIGELAFTSYVSFSDFQAIFGHVFKVIAYLLLCRAIFVTNIRTPYCALRISEALHRESERQIRAISDNLPNSVVFRLEPDADGRTKRYLYFGGSLERKLHISINELLRDPSRVLLHLHPEDLPLADRARRQAITSMLPTDTTLRMFLPRKDEADRRDLHHIWVRWSPTLLEDGHLVLDGLAMDISAWMDAEASRRALEAQLRESQKMESIGTLSAGIAHDFNNILGAILGNVALARQALPEHTGRELEFSLAQIHKAASRARTLVRQILTFSRRQTADRQVQRLQPIFDDSLELLRSTLPTRVVLDVSEVDPTIQVCADSIQLQQVILNLCTNAWQALQQGSGRIELSSSLVEVSQAGAAALALPRSGRYACITVKDDGIGMDDAVRQRMFEPFFTTKPPGEGTGLGLAVVHGIVLAHEGAIDVASAPGAGTEIRVYLPALPAPVMPTDDRRCERDDASIDGAGARVLYIDDDEIMSVMVEQLLTRKGFDVTSARDPAQALQTLTLSPHAVDIVVTDFNMPGRSGLDVIRELRTIRAELPVLLITGSVQQELAIEADSIGVKQVLAKQNAFEQLAPAIARTLACHAGRLDVPAIAARQPRRWPPNAAQRRFSSMTDQETSCPSPP